MVLSRIGRLRKQHGQIGQSKRQAWHYIEPPQIFQKLSNLSEFGDLTTSPLATGDGPRDPKMWVMLNFDMGHRLTNLNIQIISCTGSKLEYNIYKPTCRGNMRKQHQHRAHPSGVHISGNTSGSRLHQRQGEVRAVLASHHSLGGRILGPNGIRILQRHLWVLFGACSLRPHMYGWGTCYKMSMWESNLQIHRQEQTVTSLC